MGTGTREETVMSGARCECGTPWVEISLQVGEGRVTMRSCSRCDRRSWVSDGEPVGLEGVLHQIGSARK